MRCYFCGKWIAVGWTQFDEKTASFIKYCSECRVWKLPKFMSKALESIFSDTLRMKEK